MPGVLIIYGLVVAALVVAWLAGCWYTRSRANQNPREEFRQLQRHAAWLEERLDQARRERWGSQMIATLAHQLGQACEKLARARRVVTQRHVVRRR